MKYEKRNNKQAIQVALVSISLLQQMYETSNTEKNADIGYTRIQALVNRNIHKRKPKKKKLFTLYLMPELQL